MSTETTLVLILFILPFLSAGLIGIFLREKGNTAALLSVASCGLLAIISLYLVFFGARTEEGGSIVWMTFGHYAVKFGFLFDDMAALLLFIVAVVGLLVHIFSLEYMKNDPGKGRYFAGLSLFMFSMIGIVFADNLIMIFIFWELVGLSSFLLINHYFHKKSAVEASKKAFIVNRIGDFGFLLGIIWTYWNFGSLQLSELAPMVSENPDLLVTGISLLLFCSALGKSGQLPLHVWLPDAMEGPTPVSALIHAATMVAAGIYLLCRIYFLITPEALQVVLWVGLSTALFGSLCAVVQKDIKKILAYSTISQLGYMVAAFGLGALAAKEGVPIMLAGVAAALFHLGTHAFFKALLFLASGSIIHACHHEQNVFRMGGLRTRLPITFWTFTIAYLALIGLPLTAGFFSKEAILYLAFANNKAAFGILLFSAFLTAFYMTRLWLTAFFGEPKSHEAEEARENGPLITVPLIVLAVFSVIAGYEFLHPSAFAGVLDSIPHPDSTGIFMLMVGSSIIALVAGFGLAYLYYGVGAREDRLEREQAGIFGFLSAKFFFDLVYYWYVRTIQERVAQLLHFIDQIIIGGLIIRGTAGLVGLCSLGLRSLQTGNLHGYVYWIFGGVVLVWLVVKGGLLGG